MTIYAQATSGELAAGKLSKARPDYQRHHAPSRGFPRKLLPTPDRRPAQAPTPRPVRANDGIAAGMLLLLLSLGGQSLAPSRARAAWEIAGRWASQYVEAKGSQVYGEEITL